MREFTPTARVAGAGGTPLPRAIDDDLDGVRFAPLGREGTITIGEALLEAFTDGVLVLHRGTVVFERWFGVTGPETRHIAFSMTKSFVGTLAEMLVEEGRLDPAAPALDYVPELAGSGFADATVRQIMDMTTAIDFSEDYADPSSGIGALSAALALTPRPAGYAGPSCLPDFLPTIRKAGQHGEAFVYRTANTDVLAWIIARIEGRRLHETLSERLWRPLGLPGDADMLLDPVGTPFAGGLNLRLEDLARFGRQSAPAGRA
jgi:CubicO group peptidase (beta-lactamase class C family)